MDKVRVWEVEVVKSRGISIIIGVVSFVILTAFGAWVRIPVPGTPVPITLQTFFVLLGGAVLGAYGAVAQLIYVMLGTLGVPIFACGLGLLGPTGGYLIGFIVSALVVGTIINSKQNFNWVIISMLIGTVIIYLFGILQLGLFLSQSGNWGYISGFKNVFALGVLLFIPGDILKLFIAAIIYYKLKSSFGLKIFNF